MTLSQEVSWLSLSLSFTLTKIVKVNHAIFFSKLLVDFMSLDSNQVPEKEGKSDFKRTLKDKSYERLMPCMNSSSLLKIKEHKETVEFTTVWFTWMLNEHEITCGWWCCIDLLFLHEITAENDSCRFLSHDDDHRHLCLFSWKEGNYIFNYDTSKSYVKRHEKKKVRCTREVYEKVGGREKFKWNFVMIWWRKWNDWVHLKTTRDKLLCLCQSLKGDNYSWDGIDIPWWGKWQKEMTCMKLSFSQNLSCVFLCSTHSLASVKESLMNILHIHP